MLVKKQVVSVGLQKSPFSGMLFLAHWRQKPPFLINSIVEDLIFVKKCAGSNIRANLLLIDVVSQISPLLLPLAYKIMRDSAGD